MTIVAAVGNDATFGLPGVGVTPRIPQPKALVGRYIFASSMREQMELLHSST